MLSNSASSPLALPFWIPAFGTFAQHLLQCFPFDLPRPLGPFPLTPGSSPGQVLTLSHGGDRCKISRTMTLSLERKSIPVAFPLWMDVPFVEAPRGRGKS